MEYKGVKFEDRDNFIMANMGLVKDTCNRFNSRLTNYKMVELDDLINIGSIGLIKAYDNFKPEFGNKFSTYAVPKIIGEIKKFFRDYSENTGVKFSRTQKMDLANIRANGLENEDIKRITKELNLTIERVEAALEYQNVMVDSLDIQINDNDGAPIFKIDSIEDIQDFESNLMLEQFMDTLTNREKEVLELRLQDMGQTEISNIVGVSQVQISRNLKKISKKADKFWGDTEMNKKEGVDYEKATRLAWESDLTATQIAKETGISKITANKYIKDFRKNEDKNISAKNSITKDELKIDKKVKIDINPIDLDVKGNVFLKIHDVDINKVEMDIVNVAKLLKQLGFEKFNITISSGDIENAA